MEDAEMEDSQCSSMINKFCELTDSQEEKLRNCPLERESETFVDFSNSDHFSQSDCTGIVVVSAPSSADQQLPREDAYYYTPPEHHPLSHLSSSDGDQNPKIRVLEEGSGDEPESKRAKVVPGEESVGEAVALGEIEGYENEITVVGSGDSDGGGKLQTEGGENSESNGALEVTGLMKDGNAIDLGVSEEGSGDESESKRAKVVPGEEFVGEAVALGETEGDENEINVVGSGDNDGGAKPQTEGGENGESNGDLEVTGLMKDGNAIDLGVSEEGSGDDPESKRAKVVPGEKSVGEAVALGETEGEENEITVVGSGESDGGETPQTERGKKGESNGALEVTGLMKDGVAIELGVSRGEIGESSGAKKIDDFRYCDEGFELRRAHQLPPSFKGKEEEEEEEKLTPQCPQTLLDLVDLLIDIFKGKEAEDDGSEKLDIIELAKKKGVVFPRPRWWPPPGVDDEHYPP